MSSTSTMSRSLERPMMISRFIRSGNSPPWYLPEMKRSAKRGRSFMDGVAAKDSKILVPKSWTAQANHLVSVRRDRLFHQLFMCGAQCVDHTAVDLFRNDEAGMAQ